MGTIALKLLLIISYAWLYAVGGRSGGLGKLARRWIGTFLMIGGLYGLSWMGGTLSPARCLAIPLFLGTAILGYGGETFAVKFGRRLLFGSMFAGYALLLGVLYHAFLLGLAQAVLSVLASLYFGLLNPDKAAEEETAIGLLSVCLLPFIVS